MKKSISILAAVGVSMAMLLGAGDPGLTGGRRAGTADGRGAEEAVVNVPGLMQEAEEKKKEEEARRLEEEAAATGRSVADLKIDAYLADSVIIGDSIILGYRNYCMKSGEPYLKSMRFLAAGSFSVHNALWPVSEKSVHPLYQGKQRPVWESVSMMGAKDVFLFFGLNDLGVGDDTVECYQEVIKNIQEASPNVRIHIIGMTYTLKGQGKKRLNNDNIRTFNARMEELADSEGWGFIDMATPLADSEGNLAEQYCSDGFVHQTAGAYKVWTSVLRGYVGELLGVTEEEQVPSETAPEETEEETLPETESAAETQQTE